MRRLFWILHFKAYGLCFLFNGFDTCFHHTYNPVFPLDPVAGGLLAGYLGWRYDRTVSSDWCSAHFRCASQVYFLVPMYHHGGLFHYYASVSLFLESSLYLHATLVNTSLTVFKYSSRRPSAFWSGMVFFQHKNGIGLLYLCLVIANTDNARHRFHRLLFHYQHQNVGELTQSDFSETQTSSSSSSTASVVHYSMV